ncbi:hypothetical protein [Tenacibaculum jejuense]|uniref:Uncharacterized protein n=1 Tax=Tenacibaculum jejuense TaxID=584609 RepID=A0A238U424_9FLAO|nr:hypothetical protein [Tenacibaculum jejuense]SNR13953.1 protein of unknown function [Tenacibaculum jejuense]
MKPEIRVIINELIEFDKTRKPKKSLNNVYEKQGERNVYVLNGKILLWHKKVFLNLELPEKYDISEHKKLQEKFKNFFEYCPDIKKVFSFHGDHIGWSNDVSENEQQEIRDYIHENHKVPVRIRINKKS